LASCAEDTVLRFIFHTRQVNTHIPQKFGGLGWPPLARRPAANFRTSNPFRILNLYTTFTNQPPPGLHMMGGVLISEELAWGGGFAWQIKPPFPYVFLSWCLVCTCCLVT
jgi:hypothetical protein